MGTTGIIKALDPVSFQYFLRKSRNQIFISPHVLDHLIFFQRGINNIEILLSMLLQEVPKGVGLQQNGKYSLFYRRKEGFIRIVLSINNNGVRVDTFLWSDTMPNMDRL